MKSEESNNWWRELVEAEAAVTRSPVVSAEAVIPAKAGIQVDPRLRGGDNVRGNDYPAPGERCQLLLPGWEPIIYVREDVHEAELLVAYRRGRCYEAHRQRLLAVAMFAFGLAAASLAFLIVAEIFLH